MHKKGQAALEFLTTYGWAFLIILVMIGALAYFGVLNPTRFVPDTCTFSGAFMCEDSVITGPTTDSVVIKLRNSVEEVQVTAITLTDMDTGIDTYLVTDFMLAGDGAGCSATVFGGPMTVKASSVCTLTLTRGAIATGSMLTLPDFAAGVKKKVKIDMTYYSTSSGASFTKTSTGEVVATVQSN
ncbi:MAG: hypothetical protein KKF89_06085 [Nanoarchaeota archaeon]|nr:hypothetical protein [Nanoarchaeota archaeon]MBU1855268.1 hypothetical protein [Nanoarchaeota archaeon]